MVPVKKKTKIAILIASLARIGSDWRECASPTPGKANG